MPTYITLNRWTQQGIQNIQGSPGRLDIGKQAYRDVGAEVKAFYLVTGLYDIIEISEAPDDETMARLVLADASRGNVRIETLRAFNEDEYRRIIASLRPPPFSS